MKSLVKRAVSGLRPQTSRYQNRVLPAKHLRLCGQDFKSDEYFLDSARAEAERLIRRLGMTADSRVMDLGCGYGRLPIGILERIGEIRRYQGIDVMKRAIDWCNRYIHRQHPNFLFLHTDVSNRRYNPAGEEITSRFQLPFEAQSFDLIYLYSVFSHMEAPDVRIYLKEFHRLLPASGKVFLTAFVEENVPDATVNPEGYRGHKWSNALHCVRFNKNYFESLLQEHGFRVEHFLYEQETHGQSAYYLARV